MTIVKVNDPDFVSLRPVLNEWIKIHENYLIQYDYEDCLYWYNERANLSAFVGAVWKTGGFALEEYSSEKVGDRNTNNGRIDLYFSLGKFEAIVEAKAGKLYFGEKTKLDFKEKINFIVNKSVEDVAQSFPAYPHGVGLGLSFITTYWRSDYDASQDMLELKSYLENSYEDYIKNIKGQYEFAFCCLFESDRNIASSLDNYHNAVLLIGVKYNPPCDKS